MRAAANTGPPSTSDGWLRPGITIPEIAAKAAAVEGIAELTPNVAELDVDALDELEQLNVVANGARPWSRR